MSEFMGLILGRYEAKVSEHVYLHFQSKPLMNL